MVDHANRPAQFSIRGLMVVTVGVAILCAVVAPLLRRWTGERQIVFGAFTLIVVYGVS